MVLNVLRKFWFVKIGAKKRVEKNKMKKIIISIILISYFQIIHAQPLSPQMTLFPLCFQDLKTCRMASEILNLPPYGNFRLGSKCRDKTPGERQNQICHDFNGVLGIEAFIDLPNIGQFQWRNQCYPNIFVCNNAAQIWGQIRHPFGRVNISIQCSPFNRGFWGMNNEKMKELGLFICPPNDPIELKIKAVRIK
jgi:hypothetical protein